MNKSESFNAIPTIHKVQTQSELLLNPDNVLLPTYHLQLDCKPLIQSLLIQKERSNVNIAMTQNATRTKHIYLRSKRIQNSTKIRKLQR